MSFRVVHWQAVSRMSFSVFAAECFPQGGIRPPCDVVDPQSYFLNLRAIRLLDAYGRSDAPSDAVVILRNAEAHGAQRLYDTNL